LRIFKKPIKFLKIKLKGGQFNLLKPPNFLKLYFPKMKFYVKQYAQKNKELLKLIETISNT